MKGNRSSLLQKMLLLAIVGQVIAWFTVVSVYDIQKDPGGPLFFLAAGLFILGVPISVVVCLGLFLWIRWKHPTRVD